MSIEIKAIPAHVEDTNNLNLNDFNTVASGKSFKDVLQNLVAAINSDEIDTENNFLRIKY